MILQKGKQDYLHQDSKKEVPSFLIEILKKYWGYDSFRENQIDILNAILSKKDTLAILPTGGGKSLCFQVPGLYFGGLTLVISPLIALMEDQVSNLLQKNIGAAAINSLMSEWEQQQTLEKIQRGEIQFLYVSPEKLKSKTFESQLIQLPITLIAVDEAHCISQWGYDFRPSYLEIFKVREFFPKVPILALTATSTPKVAEDIVLKLNFRKENEVLKSSSFRENIVFGVVNKENKFGYCLELFQKIKGSAIVYFRSRRDTVDFTAFLEENGISALGYHAGLEGEKRREIQSKWIENEIRVICATSAFGMGIDKPDCRLVIHLDPPPSLEEYSQEAGRVGRDGKKSYAVMVSSKEESSRYLQRSIDSIPSPELILDIYESLNDFLRIEMEGGVGVPYQLDIQEFCGEKKYLRATVQHALKVMVENEILSYQEALFSPSTIQFICEEEDLQRLYDNSDVEEAFVKSILRLYGGIFEFPTKIYENQIQRVFKKWEIEKIISRLEMLHNQGYVNYVQKKEKPYIQFFKERIEGKDLGLDFTSIKRLKEISIQKAEKVIDYISLKTDCYSNFMMEYFGENPKKPCGVCQNCIVERRSKPQEDKLRSELKSILKNKQCTLPELLSQIGFYPHADIAKGIKSLLDKEEIGYNPQQMIYFISKQNFQNQIIS